MSAALSVPKSVIAGKYAILRTIGRGGAATVYEAENLVVGRRVALKLFAPNDDPRGWHSEMFVAEARAATRIGHPNVVDVLDAGFDPTGRPFLVMELCEGETLEEIVERRGPLPVPYACELALQILTAVSAAHERGIVHCDLKPSNVIVTHPTPNRPHVKVLDFGIAQAEFAVGNDESLIGAGTPLYMAPEQSLGQEVDARADVYAVAAILYQLLAGKPPFQGRDVEQLLASKLANHLVPLDRANPAVPRGLAAAVADALTADREQRPGSAWQLARAIAPFMITSVPEHPPAGSPSIPIPLSRPKPARHRFVEALEPDPAPALRRPGFAGIAGMLLLGLGLGLGLGWALGWL